MTRLESDYYSYMDFDPEHTREVLRHYVPMFEDNSPVLELGCGRGEFLGLLRREGHQGRRGRLGRRHGRGRPDQGP